MRFSVVRVLYSPERTASHRYSPCFPPMRSFVTAAHVASKTERLENTSAKTMPRKPKTPVVPGAKQKRVAPVTVAPYASAPLGAPPVVRMASPRPIAKQHPSKHERFASAIQAPSPSCLPKPPSSWTRVAPPTSSSAQLTSPLSPPPITLQRSDVVQKQLQGNLLFSMLGSAHPAPTLHL